MTHNDINQTRQTLSTDTRAMESRIVLEEIRMLYGSMPFSVSATLAVGLIIYLALYAHADSLRSLHIWFGGLVAITLLRGWCTWLFNHSTAEAQNREIWGTRFIFGSTVSGFWWGMLPWLGYSSENEYLILIVVCIVGVAGGSLATLSYRWQSIASFLLPLLVLLEIRLVLEGSNYTNVVALLLAAFILFSLSTARRVYRNSNQNIRLRIEADYREDALRKAKDEAEQANKAKSQFLSSMSHELRTPLNAILGYAQLLEYDNSLPQNQLSNLREISSAGRLLLELVNQILDLAKLEEGSPAHGLVDIELTGADEALALTFRIDRQKLAQAQTLDGRYALATNATHLDATATLTLFKGQDGVEKRFRTIKGPLLVHPLFVRSDRRIEGLVFISLSALLVRAILERACRQQGLSMTADRLLRAFAFLQAVDLVWSDGSIQRRAAEMTDIQAQVLHTLDWPTPATYV